MRRSSCIFGDAEMPDAVLFIGHASRPLIIIIDGNRRAAIEYAASASIAIY